MTREQKMQAVVDAAREQARDYTASGRLLAALDALDALDADAEAGETEMREVYGVIKNDDGVIYMIDHSLEGGYAGHVIANVTARVPLPTAPTITATVTLPLDRERGA